MKSKRLSTVFKVLLEEVEQNHDLAERIERALGAETAGKQVGTQSPKMKGEPECCSRGKSRRAPAVLDPVMLVQDGADALTDKLQALDLEQLRDIVAEYGMDPQRLVMKWKTKKKLIEHTVMMALNATVRAKRSALDTGRSARGG